MGRKIENKFSLLFGQKGKKLILADEPQIHKLQEELIRKKIYCGKSAVIDISCVKIFKANEETFWLYFCPIKGIEVEGFVQHGYNGGIPAPPYMEELENFRIQNNAQEGIWNMKNVLVIITKEKIVLRKGADFKLEYVGPM